MKVYSVYIVTLRENGKPYVGWTDDVAKRWRRHLRNAANGSKWYFHCALRKYGEDAFDWEIVQSFASEEEAKQAEIFWIAELNTNHCRDGHGFNSTDGGDGVVGHRHTFEHRQHLSINSVAKRPEVRAKMSITRLAMGNAHPSKRATFKERMSGSNNPSAKLTDEATIFIRFSVENGGVLARRFGISRSRVSEIKRNIKRHG